jgi:hypothetical protein
MSTRGALLRTREVLQPPDRHCLGRRGQPGNGLPGSSCVGCTTAIRRWSCLVLRRRGESGECGGVSEVARFTRRSSPSHVTIWPYSHRGTLTAGVGGSIRSVARAVSPQGQTRRRNQSSTRSRGTGTWCTSPPAGIRTTSERHGEQPAASDGPGRRAAGRERPTGTPRGRAAGAGSRDRSSRGAPDRGRRPR